MRDLNTRGVGDKAEPKGIWIEATWYKNTEIKNANKLSMTGGVTAYRVTGPPRSAPDRGNAG